MAFDEFFYKTNSNCFSTRFDLTNFFMIKYVSTYFETDWKRLRESNSIVPLPSVFSKFQKCQQISVGQSEIQKKMYKYSDLQIFSTYLFDTFTFCLEIIFSALSSLCISNTTTYHQGESWHREDKTYQKVNHYFLKMWTLTGRNTKVQKSELKSNFAVVFTIDSGSTNGIR